jgi:NTE family protein
MLFDLVFEGGGVRGVAFIGALEALADNGHEFDRLMGASVGGLTAALLATGHDAHSIREIMFDPQTDQLRSANYLKPFPDFDRGRISASATRKMLEEIDLSFVPNLIEGRSDELLAQTLMNLGDLHPFFSIIEHMGINQDQEWLDWINGLLNVHADEEDWAGMGLAAFFGRTGRSLTVMATDISSESMLVLNHSTAPNLPLGWAIRMTTAVPMLFPPVIWRPEWGLYRNRRLEGHLILDGALLSQFPIEYFLSTQEEIVDIMGERKAGNNVLGLLLDETAPAPGIVPKSSEIDRIFSNVPGVNVGRMLLKTLLSNSNNAAGNPLEKHILRLPVMGVDPFDFTVSYDELRPVVNAAYNAAQDFLYGWERDPRSLLSPFEQQYAQVVAEKFVVSGDYYSIGDIVNSRGIAIGQEANAEVRQTEISTDVGLETGSDPD